MDAIKLIEAVEVVRDETGCWWHPDMPDFDEGDGKNYDAWLADQGLVTASASLEGEQDSHPAYIKYFDEGDADFSGWTPEAPRGDGWFTLCIGDTEDGPVWCWVQRTATTKKAPTP